MLGHLQGRYQVAENDNGQRADFDQAQDHAGIIQNPQSRRKFLRVAAVGAAGVAGVAGAAGVARATGLAPKTLLHFNGSPQDPSTPTPDPKIAGYFEETKPGPCVSTYTGSTGNGGINRYITFYISNLPSGNYSFDVTQTIGANTGSIQSAGGGTATLHWEYKVSNSQVHVVIPAAPLDSDGCPTQDDLGGSKSTPSNAFPVSFSTGSTQNVAIYAHIIDNQSPLLGPTTFTGSLSGDKMLSTDITVNLV